MKRYKQFERLVTLLAGLTAGALTACASGPAMIEDGPGAEVTVDGLHKVANSAFRDAWVKPSADFRAYSAVVLDPVDISYRRKPKSTKYSTGSGNFALTDDQMARMKRYFRDVFTAELTRSPHYGITDSAGPAVLRLTPSIIDLRVKVPTELTPDRGRIYVTNVGNMTLMLELRDSLSGELLARVADRREARISGGFDLRLSTSVSNTNAVKSVFRRWAEILRTRLDAVYALEPSASLED